VFGLSGGGAYAEALVTHERMLARIPEGMSFVEAAAVPEAFVTAYDALVTQGGLTPGATVLVHAVGSGVGTAAIQIARALAARSIGTARTADKLARARDYGLDQGIAILGAAFADEVMRLTEGRGVDIVLELVGGDYVREDVACLASKGRILLVGLLAGASAPIDLGAMLRRRATLRGTVLRSRPIEEKIAVMQVFAREVVPLFASGRLRPVVDQVLPLADAAAAHLRLEQGDTFGKLVLDCG
jgi:NADPH:quinone reductase-like Zn-dependent oxidoreductase